MTLQQQNFQSMSSSFEANTDKNIESGLDIILSHFEEPSLFPRRISTYKSHNRQFSVSDKQEIINSFRDSNFIDCRINAFPPFTNYKEVQICPPNLLFIDLDKNDFKSITVLKSALVNTLKNIIEKLNGVPTVLWSGNGFHIIQPIYCPIPIENISEFNGFDRPSEQFLRFAKNYLSNGKADKNNNPSFKSCLLRIPNSINSKSKTKVEVVRKWNGLRPSITKELLLDFRRYLIQKQIDEYNNRQKIIEARTRNRKNKNNINFNINNNNNFCYYDWIENKVLQTPLQDYRKLAVGLILTPYLVVIKKLSYEESYKIIYEWLMKCDSVRKLNFDPKYLINNNIKTSAKKLIPPILIYKLETNYPNFYFLIDQKKRKKEEE